MTPLRIDETYNEDNQVATITRYSDLAGTTTVSYSAYSYDTVNRLTNLITKKGSDNSVLSNFTYTYDPGSRLNTEVDNGTTVTYSYDTTNQLTADGSSTFTFDGTGNRDSGSYGVTTGNEITTDGVWTYTFDAEGNLTKKSKGAAAETWTYAWDNKNELTSAEDRATDGGTLLQKVTYKYDPMGDRIESAVDSNGDSVIDTTTRAAYDGWKTGAMPPSGFIGNENFDIWADLDGQNSNALLTRYVRGSAIDQVFARIGAGGAAYWLLTDRQGSIRDVQDNSTLGLKDTIVYDGWGNISSETDSTYRGRYAWTGRELDTETGLQYNRARYYDAKTGRWISQDPLGFDAGDSNLYRYASNRATSVVDPSGLLGGLVAWYFRKLDQGQSILKKARTLFEKSPDAMAAFKRAKVASVSFSFVPESGAHASGNDIEINVFHPRMDKDINKIVGVLLFETLNVVNAQRVQRIAQTAARGDISLIDLVLTVEYSEYRNMVDFNQIVDASVKNKKKTGWTEDARIGFGGYAKASFDQYLSVQIPKHTNLYVNQWRGKPFEKMFEKQHKGADPTHPFDVYAKILWDKLDLETQRSLVFSMLPGKN